MNPRAGELEQRDNIFKASFFFGLPVAGGGGYAPLLLARGILRARRGNESYQGNDLQVGEKS
jgi:hypothetical protein